MATTNIGTLLLNELQALSTEARRKHPDIKEAAERVIVVLRGIKATTTPAIAQELAKSDEVIRPFVLGCKSNNHKLTAISVQCLQQLISNRALSTGSIRATLSTLNAVINQSVDIQVKILQMLLPLVSIYEDIIGEALVDAIHMCFVLQQSKDAIVNNTAAAILRQLVVAVFDRVVEEDKDYEAKEDKGDAGDQDMTRKYAKDAYFMLQDLCILVSDGAPIFIRAEVVDKGLVLELIESVLTHHAKMISRHAGMSQILRERLSPFIVKFFNEKSAFPLVVRCIRIIWLFIRDLHAEFNTDCEIFLSILTKLVNTGIDSTDSAATSNSKGAKLTRTSISSIRSAGFLSGGGGGGGSTTTSGFPPFYSILAMETIMNTVTNADLLHQLYIQFDGCAVQSAEGDQADAKDKDCHVIFDVISTVGKIVSAQSHLYASTANGVPKALASRSASTATNVDNGYRRGGNESAGNGHLQSGADAASSGQVSARGCRVRTEIHKLLDKQDPPSIPEHYLFYLALSTFISLAEGMASYVLPKCTVSLARRATGTEVSEPVLDPSFDVSKADTRTLGIRDFSEKSWSTMLAAYSFFLGVKFDDSLFNQVMDAIRKLAQVFGALGLREARNALISLLCRSCLPQASIADHERQLQAGHETKAFGLTAVPESSSESTAATPSGTLDSDTKPPAAGAVTGRFALPLVTTSLAGVQFTMHPRQIQCLRAILSCSRYLASVLGPTWYPIMVTLQQANELLYQSRGIQASSSSGIGANAGSSAGAGSAANGAYMGAGQTRAGSRRTSTSSSAAPVIGS
ncbi:Endocytosis and vacuole integrity protein, partial [Dipsacomyces acuminosporus]